ncbi:MAG: aldose 1-epimerase family protein [Clostridia bacterium]
MIIEITDGICTAKVSSRGAELVSFIREDGFETLWQGDPTYWSSHAPILFPIVSAVRHDKVKIDGQWTEITKHGLVRKSEFELASQTKDEVVFTIKSNEDTLKSYPFEFLLTVGYKIVDKTVVTNMKVENLGDGTMPFFIGGHPGFNVPMTQGETFEDYYVEFSENETLESPVVDTALSMFDFTKSKYSLKNEKIIPITREMFSNDVLVFEGFKSKSIALKSKKSTASIVMDLAGFPVIGIWSPYNDAPFVALEPWVGCGTTFQESDNIEEKMHCQYVKKDEEYNISFTVGYTL